METCCQQPEVDDPSRQEVACCDCGLNPLCQVVDYGASDLADSKLVLRRRQPMQRGELLFSAKQPFSALFAVKSGSFKAISVDLSGKERVVGFYLPGDLIGAEGIANRVHSFTVRALEESAICRMDLPQMPQSGRGNEMLQGALIHMLGEEVSINHLVTSSLIQQNAEQRLAAFILNLSVRCGMRGLSQYQLGLSMSRSDIASYLGLARETVSRTLTRFQNYGLIGISKHVLKVVNPEGLQKVTLV
ncbi:MAG: helix-turn-helix domain-containing protein [Candidatus Thiodiazotropha endolucinida]|nr:helix-turn-helix domain-containing protein [Candidatus Thiodiazotropha taylori]MCW4312368.1 helix-turn-helix domain-containing protein [Candidatus Thiodiazotropha taylori]